MVKRRAMKKVQADTIERGKSCRWPRPHSTEYYYTGISEQDGEESYKIFRPEVGPSVAIEVCDDVWVEVQEP